MKRTLRDIRSSLSPRSLPAFFAFTLAYTIGGRLGLLLAIPPGYASAIFPPAGLAVATMFIRGRITLPWTFLASFLLNLYVGYATVPEKLGTVVAVAIIIAAASTLQAALGGWALRRLIGYPAALDNSRDLSRFILLAPLICLTSATSSLAGMWAAGAIKATDLFMSWLTWWIGDTLGVLLVLPLVMVVAGEPRLLWRTRARSVALPMVLFFALFVAIFIEVSTWENDQSLLEFRLLSQQVVDKVQERLGRQEVFLEQVERSFAGPAALSADAFRHLVQTLLRRNPSIQAVEWAPRITAEQRGGFEASQRRDIPGFEIRERDPSGVRRRIDRRDAFYPVTYVEPLQGNEDVVGFDLGADPDRRTAIAKTFETGAVTATAPVRLVQQPEKQTGVLLTLAVNDGANGPGIVLVVLRMGVFTHSVLAGASEHIQAQLLDREQNQVLFDDFTTGFRQPRYEQAFTFGSRSYVMRTMPTAAYLASHRGWESLAVLMAGVLSTGLLGALLMLGSGERHRFASLLEDRTRERDRIWQVSEDLLGVSNFAGYFVSFNPAWTRVLGWSEDEIRRMHVSELRHPDDAPIGIEGRKRLAAGVPTVRMENRFRCKEGTYRWIYWTMTAEQGLIYVIGRDVTAEKEAAASLRRAEEQLRQSQKMQALGQLTGGIAHDFNNLLTVIIGNLEVVQRSAPASAGKIVKLAAAAMNGAMRAANLTQRLLAYAQRQPLNPSAVDLNQLITSMVDLIRQTHGEDVRCEFVLGQALGSCFCDANQLETALLNLVINARDAMPHGGRLRIETESAFVDDAAAAAKDVKVGAYVTLSVRDEGVGMSPQTRAAAFEPFFTTKALGKGTGLGLSMVYGFVRQSHGHVEIDSEIGQGTTVRILLPQVTAAKAGGAPPDALPVAMEPQGAGETILVVEDDENVRSFIADSLRDLQYRVLVAEEAKTALMAIADKATRIDLLLTDVVLPGMNGRELANEAKAIRPGIKMLFMTGYARDVIVHQGRLDPGIELIEKPFRQDALAARIRAILDADAAALSAVARANRTGFT